MQRHCMETNWAAEHLQIIRTLMERSALYRRALAPIMIFAGLIGIGAAVAGAVLGIKTQTEFTGYWMSVALAGVAGAFLLVRRQALKKNEPFWSPPARRVAQALLPPLTAGLLLGVLVFIVWSQPAVVAAPNDMRDHAGDLLWLPALWAVFYGCALHAAGFFTLRGLRLFGWLFIAAGNLILLFLFIPREFPELAWQNSHYLMGFLFGFLQLAYGVYLYVTEKRDL